MSKNYKIGHFDFLTACYEFKFDELYFHPCSHGLYLQTAAFVLLYISCCILCGIWRYNIDIRLAIFLYLFQRDTILLKTLNPKIAEAFCFGQKPVQKQTRPKDLSVRS